MGESSVRLDQVGLFEPEVEGLFQSDAGDAIFPIKGGDDYGVAKGELRHHYGEILLYRPVENSGTVGEGQVIRAYLLARSDEGKLVLYASILVPKKKDSVFFLVRLVENDEPPGSLGPVWRGDGKRATDYLGKPGPLTKVARGIEVGHPGSVVLNGVTLLVPDHKITFFLIDEGYEKVLEQAP